MTGREVERLLALLRSIIYQLIYKKFYMNARTLVMPLFARQLFLWTAALLLSVLCCYSSLLAPRAHAASLTEPQIQSILSLLTAFGVDQATIINVDGILHGTATAPSYTPTPVASSDIASLRSYPSFAVKGATDLVNGSLELLILSVGAQNTGDIKIRKVTFGLATQGVSVSNLVLVGPDGNVSSSTYAHVSTAGDRVTVYFDSAINPSDAYVAAGTSKIYRLRGVVAGVTSAAVGKVTLTLLSDLYSQPLATAATVEQNGANVIWSPESATSGVVPADNDWTNGYGLTGLPSSNILQSNGVSYGIPSATLSFSVDPSTPSFATVVAGSATPTTVGVYKVHAANDAITLTKLGVKLSEGNAAEVSSVSFYSGSGTLLGSAVFGSGQTIATSTFIAPLSIPANTDAKITVKATFSRIGTAQAGTEGQIIRIDPSSAEGQSSTAFLETGGSGNVVGVRVYKTLPSFAISGSSDITNGNNELLSLIVSANSAQDVGLYKLSFSLALQGVSLSGVRLNGPNGNVSSSYAHVSGNRIEVYFDSPVNTADALVGAGTSKTYSLYGTVSGLTSAGGKVTLTLLSDAAQQPLNSALGLDNSGANVIWSPLTYTSYPGITANDWTNGYGLSSLPTKSVIKQQAATTASAAPTCSISASRSTATVGDSATFTWATTNAGYVIVPGGAHQNANGSQSVTFTSSGIYNYSVEAVSADGSQQKPCAASVTVSPKPSATPAPTCSISASPSTVPSGQYTTYTWSSTNSTSASLSNLGSVATSGSDNFAAQYFAFTTQGNHTETLTVIGPGGSATCNTVVTVTAPAAAHDSATPSVTSGTAPLTVNFSFNLNTAKSCDSGLDYFYYGDETGSIAGEYLAWPADSCNITTTQTTHTYTKPGTYTASLATRTFTTTWTQVTVWSQTITVASSTASLDSSNMLANVLSAFLHLFGWDR